MKLRTVREADVKNKKVIVRVDFNVPLDADGNVVDDFRIRAALPTIQYLIDNGAKIILISHLGRPKGKRDKKYSLVGVAKRLAELLHKEVLFAPDVIGEEVELAVNGLRAGDVLLCENVRFHEEEEKNDPEFAKTIASMGELYVNDAFSASHRAHATVEAITKYLPSYAGFLMEKEVNYLSMLTENPERPYFLVLGGAKVSDKVALLQNLLPKVDGMVIGGAMVFTFWKAQGKETGKSIVEADLVDFARQLMEDASKQGKEIVLAQDFLVSDEAKESVSVKNINDFGPEDIGYDIGPESIKSFKNALVKAKTVFWNGPLGLFEEEKFANGTREVGTFLGDFSGTVVVGGGDTANAVREMGLFDKFDHVSTGGGASLEFLEGKVLPGIAPLLEA
ncbi:phosphoglycerate kinase [Coprothermobacter platensis]|uniref:phosphoglycerate kinase n=1 Tax=Coprothermobacter platensis TaxID=108819 RepID=UPI00037382B5|nr:phosphoglycerate kinase [Coprothermobacter platensis]